MEPISDHSPSDAVARQWHRRERGPAVGGGIKHFDRAEGANHLWRCYFTASNVDLVVVGCPSATTARRWHFRLQRTERISGGVVFLDDIGVGGGRDERVPDA